MGTCKNVIASSIAKKHYQTCPADTASFEKDSRQKKQYVGKICNLKIQSLAENLVGSEFGVSFSIDNMVDIEYSTTAANNGKIQWKLENKFNIMLNDYETRVKFVKVVIKNKESKKLYQFKINFYRILVGPFHHDFRIGHKGRSYGRLIFDIKISQVITLQLKALQASVIFNLQHPGDIFNFTLESNINRNNLLLNQSKFDQSHKRKSIKSIPSYKQSVPIQTKQKFRSINQKDGVQNQTYHLKRKISNFAKQETAPILKWQIKKNNRMPFLQIKIKSCQILSSIFIFKLFRFIEDQKFVEFGQFEFTFSQLIALGFMENVNKDFEKQNRYIKFQKSISQNGKLIGKCCLQLSMKFKNYVNQTANCSLTEDGIISMSFLEVYRPQHKKQEQQSQNIQKHLLQILSLIQQKHASTSFYSRSHLSKQIFNQLGKLNQDLSQNMRNSYVFQGIGSQRLRQKKKMLVRILDILASLIEESDIELSQLCWKNIVCIMKRGQMALKYWEILPSKISNQIITAKQNSQNLSAGDSQIGLDYVRVLYKLLKLSLSADISVFLSQSKQSCQIFKSFSYFRIPLFRNQLLKIIKNKLLQQKLKLKQYDIDRYSLIVYSPVANSQTAFELDWQNRFYVHIKNSQKGTQMQKQLQNFMENCFWFDDLCNSQEIFCNFVKNLVSNYAAFRDKLKLGKKSHFQGYEIILKGFLLTLCENQMLNYRHYTVATAMSLLQNENVIHPLLQILYRKVNLYCQPSLLRLAHMLTHFFHTLSKPMLPTSASIASKAQSSLAGSSLPLNFPYSAFMLPLKKILQLRHSISLSYYLTFIYAFYHTFQTSFRYELVQYLLGRLFWSLCYNWSYNIRKLFYHIVILKIGQDAQLRKRTDIQEKLFAMSRIITNGSKLSNLWNKDLKQRHDVKNQLHISMKKKLNLKKCQKFGQNWKPQKGSLQDQINLGNLTTSKFGQDYIQITDLNMKRKCASDLSQFLASKNQNQHPLSNIQNKPNRLNQGVTNIKTYHDQQGLNALVQDDLPEFPFLNLSKNQTKFSFLSHKLVYSCFNQADFAIPVIDPVIRAEIKQHLELAEKQFRQIYETTFSYCKKNGALPAVEFEFKIEIDEKDVLPDSFDQTQFQ